MLVTLQSFQLISHILWLFFFVYFLLQTSGYLFTNNQDIVHRLRALAPYNAGFQVAYGIYGSAQGVLRATSHQLDLLG